MKILKTLSIFWLACMVTLFSNVVTGSESPYYGSSNRPHHFTFLKTGPVALQARLDLINSAQDSIEFEYFVFKTDEVGRLLLQALAKKAREGVDVKIMFDHFGSFTQVSKYLVRELVLSGVQFRVYNKNLANLYLAQFRNHRKLIVVDGETVLTGGRNVSKRYYGISEDYNLADRDFILEGEIVETIRKSFYAYWNSSVVETRRFPRRIGRFNFIKRIREKRAQTLLREGPADRRLLRDLEHFVSADMNRLPQSQCHDITYVTDVPGIGREAMGEDFRLTREEVYRRMRSASHRVYIESPYIVFDEVKEDLINELLEDGIEVAFKSNSLRATNVLPVTAVFYDQIRDWLDIGVEAYLFKGDRIASHSDFPGTESAEWGIHSKMMMFDWDHVMLGSFNFDPRSTVWNTEYAVFCRDENVGRIIGESVSNRLEYSHHLFSRGDLREFGFKGASLWRRILYQNVRYPADWLSFLL